MKVGVLTHPVAGNYGGMLQAYAMVKALNQCGYEAYNLEYEPRSFKRRLTHPIKRIKDGLRSFLYRHKLVSTKAKPPFTLSLALGQEFRAKNIPTIKIDTPQGVDLQGVDAIVVGSDQVWRKIYAAPMKSLPYFFLSFAPDAVRKASISYAASFGTDRWEGNDEETVECARLLREFKAVSVREMSGVDICQKYFATEAIQIADPTFLLQKEDYDLMIDAENTYAPEAPFLSAYVLDNKNNIESMLRGIASSIGVSMLHLNALTRKISKHLNFPLTVPQWLRFIRDSQYLITDSFHGCVFAIIFNKPFICLGNKKRGTARFESLLTTYGLQDRLLTELTQEKVKTMLTTPIDWDKVNAFRASECDRGLQFITSNIPIS